jgi:hypothetical protein
MHPMWMAANQVSVACPVGAPLRRREVVNAMPWPPCRCQRPRGEDDDIRRFPERQTAAQDVAQAIGRGVQARESSRTQDSIGASGCSWVDGGITSRAE